VKWVVPTEGTMQHVEIKQGWLIDQFAEHVLGLDIEDESVATQAWLTEINPDIADALIKYDALVVQKNKQYKDAWQVDGPLTALTDLKDKLYRLEAVNEKGLSVTMDKDKLTGTLYDILIRTVMCLAWYGLNFKDDDLDDPVDANR